MASIMVMNVPLSWIILFIVSIFSVILLVFFCICWPSRKKQNQAYLMDSDTLNRSELPNNLQHIVEDSSSSKQKYFLHGIKYSSINTPDELSHNKNDHFSYNILSIFRNIQVNKFPNNENDMTRILSDNLEDSNTELMHKTFDKSVLTLQWNENSDSNSCRDKDETYSCISSDSKGTFKSVLPFYNRSQSVAETFKSTNSEGN